MILKTEDIRFVFNPAYLQPGDILLMETYDEEQRKRMPEDKYLHAAIYIGDAYLIEADGLGVVMNHLLSYAFKKADHACALRLKKRNRQTINKVIYWARKQMGKDFGSKQAILVPIKKNTEEKDNSNRTFCSRLVAQAYNSAGIKIVNNPNFCSPDDILKSNALEIIPHSVQPFTDEMEKAITTHQYEREHLVWNDSLQLLFAAMNAFYGNGCDIQTINQLIHVVLENTDKEEEAISIMKQQKWMTSPHELTQIAWPWFYEDDKFIQHFPIIEDALFFICNQFLHYDNTFLPIFRKNVVNIIIIAHFNKNCKIIQLIKEQLSAVLDEANKVRKRLEELYIKLSINHKKEFFQFTKKYGFYKQYQHKDIINVDLCEIMNALTPHHKKGI